MRNRDPRNHPEIRDYGHVPFVFNIDHAATMNRNFRTTLWTAMHRPRISEAEARKDSYRALL